MATFLVRRSFSSFCFAKNLIHAPAASIPLFLSFVGIPYGRVCLTLAHFHLWPFGKFLVRSVRITRLVQPPFAARVMLQ